MTQTDDEKLIDCIDYIDEIRTDCMMKFGFRSIESMGEFRGIVIRYLDMEWPVLAEKTRANRMRIK